MPELLRFLICLIGQLKIALGKGGFNICTRLFLLDISSNCCLIAQVSGLVYRVTNGDGSGYNRKNGVQRNTKSKVGGAIINEEYRSPEA